MHRLKYQYKIQCKFSTIFNILLFRDFPCFSFLLFSFYIFSLFDQSLINYIFLHSLQKKNLISFIYVKTRILKRMQAYFISISNEDRVFLSLWEDEIFESLEIDQWEESIFLFYCFAKATPTVNNNSWWNYILISGSSFWFIYYLWRCGGGVSVVPLYCGRKLKIYNV